MKDILKLCLSLGFFCAISGLALAFVNQITAEPCRRAEEAERGDKLKLVLPAETAETQMQEASDGVQFFRALDAEGKLLAYAAEGTSNNGFGGELRVLAGLSPEGRILGILVSRHNETPGIGTQITDRKATRSLWEVFAGKAELDPFPANACLDSYADKPLEETFSFDGANAVLSVSGATITSKAVLAAVNSISQAWQKKKSSAAMEEK